MKKIYLMAISAVFAMSANAQSTIKLKVNNRAEKVSSVAKTGPSNSTQQITGGITCNTQYVAGTTMNLQFTIDLTNTDSEYGDMVTLTFPAGITPNATGHSAAIGTESLNPVAGQVVTWGDNDNNFGGIVPGSPINFTVNVTVGAGVTGNQNATYDVSGDQYAAIAPAGDLIGGSCTIFPAGATVINMQTKLMGIVTNTVTFDQASTQNCSMGMGVIVSQIHNLGTNSESNIPVNYSVNGVASTPTTFTGTIAPGDSALILFPIPYDFSNQGLYKVKTWTALSGDVALANDSIAVTIANSLPVALTNTANVYTNGVETPYELGSTYLDWVGVGAAYGLSTVNFHSGAQAYFLTIPGTAPVGTYESFVNLPCVDVVNGESYRISYWRKSSTSGTLTVNGQTGVFSGLTQDAAGMTDVVKAYTAMTPTAAAGVNGWQKDSVDYVATATETRYFAIGGKGTIAGASSQISIRLDDFRIAKVVGSVGIKSLTNNDVISIFPNPTSGIININAIETNSSIEVINVIGEKVYANTLVKGNNVVDLSGLANGAYFVKLNSNGSITTKKVVLSK